jgi:hypothetical protein
LDARLTTLLCKKIVAKSKEMKTRYNLTKSSKEGCGSKGAVLPIIMMMFAVENCHYHYMIQTYNNTRAHKRGYTSELYSLTEVQQFRTAILEAPDDDHVGRNM